MIEQLLEYNREFVKSGAYEKFQTSKAAERGRAMEGTISSVNPAARKIRLLERLHFVAITIER